MATKKNDGFPDQLFITLTSDKSGLIASNSIEEAFSTADEEDHQEVTIAIYKKVEVKKAKQTITLSLS